MSETNDDRARLTRLVSAATTAMFTTMTADGRHVSRPMALQEAEFDGDLWFFASETSAKVTQIAKSPQVNISFSDEKHHSWTSISGVAAVVHDRAKAEQLYEPVLQAWFPQGLDTPDLTLIKVTAETAEYWEGPDSSVAFGLGVLRAAVTRQPREDPIENGTVEL